jgi:3-oxoacyl-[acyl-carrier-protein] synthase-1
MTKVKVYITNDHVASALGNNTAENWSALQQGKSGVSQITPSFPCDQVVYGSIMHDYEQVEGAQFKIEHFIFSSLSQVIVSSGIQVKKNDRIQVIISTVKGNVTALEQDKIELAYMPLLTQRVQDHFHLYHEPLVVSNACVSGLLAIQTAYLLLQQNHYDHVLVVGADEFSSFTLSGFYAFKALSHTVCKPFDRTRDGINLGEGVATVLLTSKPEQIKESYRVEVCGVGTSNDANHISGPSRDGSGLKLAIEKAMKGHDYEHLQYINAHGTGTNYNDNMESLAFQSLGLSHVPLNSLKAYYGHTLGAAGVIETVMSIQSMLNHELIKSLGFEQAGTEGKVNVLSHNMSLDLNMMLKTASGFGGCNTAIVLKRV